MEKKKSFGRRLEDFFAGKGFYIVLFLCVAVIGVSAWALLTGSGTDVDTPAVEIAATADVMSENEDEAQTGVVEAEEPVIADEGAEAAGGEGESAQTVEEDTQTVEVFNEDGGSEPAAAASYFVWPVNGEVDLPYSMDALVYNSTMADWRTHSGIDLAAELGTQVMACAAGVIESVYTDDMYGVTVVIDHYGGLKSVYSNLAEVPTVNVGDSVVAGEVIGAVGDTALCEIGQVTHLHFAMTQDGVSVDPSDYMPGS